MSKMGEVIEGYPLIMRLTDVQMIPGMLPNGEAIPCVHLSDVEYLNRQAFMAGSKGHMSWERFRSIMSSWRSNEQRAALINATVDLEKIHKRAEANVQQFSKEGYVNEN